MSTANQIEAITDAGDFEILATRTLRQIDADYARVEHLGVNADGKCVKGPVDGFTKVPGSNPPRFVMAAFSTDQVDNIQKKLLFDHAESKGKSYKPSDDGDLLKAARLAGEIRHTAPNAEFVFTFCTNKQPADGVMQAGYAAGSSLGIEVRFLARSTLRDHLDTTPEGQWLRKQHLGISADMLSLSLLRELSSQSVAAYRHELFCSEDAIIDTTTTKRLLSLTSFGQESMSILTGPSGSGKSVACYRLVSDVTATDGIGLWLPAETAAQSMSLDEAISKVLRNLCPTLGEDSGRVAQALAAEHKTPLVVVVDDVNRAATPSRCISKLISWNRRAAANESNAGVSRSMSHLVIPVWNHFWNSISSRYQQDRLIAELSTQPMTADEAHSCLEACVAEDIGRQSSSELARRLEFDPILIGLWGSLYGHSPSDHLDAAPRTLIAAYIQQAVDECCSDGALLPADIHAALDLLAEKMLAERNLYPSWSLVVTWLDGVHLDAIRRLCVSGSICRVVARDAEDRFAFRHDRLLEAVIAKPLGACLSDIDANRDLISDPYLTDSLARAIVSKGDSALISAVVNHAPLAVLRTLRHLDDSTSELAIQITECGATWLAAAVADKLTPPEVVFAASEVLRTIKNPMVLAVSEHVKDDHQFSGARLVNGDAKWGKYFVGGRHFYPGSRAPYIEDTVSDAARLHFSTICEQLAEELATPPHSKRELNAALILAGYLGHSSLAGPVLHAWKHDKNNECLLEALWASLRCSTEPDATLAPILDSWASLSDERDQHGWSERNAFLDEVTWSMRHGVNDEVAEHLVSRAQTDKRLSSCLTFMLADIDHPTAVDFVARDLARIEREVKGTERFSFWPHRCREKWDPLHHNGRRLSNESRAEILNTWKVTQDEAEKESLLCTWVATTDSLEELLDLPAESKDVRFVLSRRAQLGDPTCVESVLKQLEEYSYWWEYVPTIWTDRFVDVLDVALEKLAAETPDDYSGGKTNDHFHLSRVLRDIPIEVSQMLLLKHWEALKYSPQFFQVAVYVGGETLLAACEQVVADAPEHWEPLKHVGMSFGFKMVGLQDRLTYRHVDAILTHIDRVPDMELMGIADWLVSHGREDVLRERLWDEISRRVEVQRSEGDNSYVVRLTRLHFPSDEDLLEALEGAEEDRMVVWRWCRASTERGDSMERLRKILREWLFKEPTPERLIAVANIVAEIGERTDARELIEQQSRFGNEETAVVVEGASFVVRYKTLT